MGNEPSFIIKSVHPQSFHLYRISCAEAEALAEIKTGPLRVRAPDHAIRVPKILLDSASAFSYGMTQKKRTSIVAIESDDPVLHRCWVIRDPNGAC